MKKVIFAVLLSMVSSTVFAGNCASVKVFDQELNADRSIGKICTGETMKLASHSKYTVSANGSEHDIDTTVPVTIKLLSADPVKVKYVKYF